jgi:hypothetical protein
MFSDFHPSRSRNGKTIVGTVDRRGSNVLSPLVENRDLICIFYTQYSYKSSHIMNRQLFKGTTRSKFSVNERLHKWRIQALYLVNDEETAMAVLLTIPKLCPELLKQLLRLRSSNYILWMLQASVRNASGSSWPLEMLGPFRITCRIIRDLRHPIWLNVSR